MRVRIHRGTKEIGGTCIEVDLERFAKALAPRKLMHLRSFETPRGGEFFDDVVQAQEQ